MASASTPFLQLTAANARYCYLDFDIDHHRAKLALTAAFVNATDTRYGLSSSELRHLGGSELARLADLLQSDHEWSDKVVDGGDSIVDRVAPVSSAGHRLLVWLDWETAPLACQNFATLCANGGGDRSFVSGTEKKVPPAPVGDSGKPLTYRGSSIHRVIRNFVVQGGDFVFGNGSGGESIYNGKPFKDERAGLQKKHDQRGVLSMGNSGKNSNTSQFFVTLAAAPQCDGKHVVFGRVVSGLDLLDAVEALAPESGETPTKPIGITDCGVWTPLATPAAGYWYDKPDAHAFSGVSPLFLVRPRAAVVAPTAAVHDKFAALLGGTCVVVKGDKELLLTAPQVETLLQTFAVDVVLVAPACKEVLLQVTQLPPSWTDRRQDIAIHQVVMEAKPIDALECVRQQSWLAQSAWHLDGAT